MTWRAVLLFSILCVNAASAVDRLPTISVPRSTGAPVIDGNLDDPVWKSAGCAPLFFDWKTAHPAEVNTRGLLTWDDDSLYVAFECEEPLTDTIRASQTERDSMVYGDDCVQFFIQPHGHDEYFHIVLNARGTIYDSIRADGSWSAGILAAGSIGQGQWVAEMAIPWPAIGGPPSPEKPWMGMLARERRAREGNNFITSWPFSGGPFHNTGRFGKIVFVDQTATLHRLDVGERLPGMNRLTADVRGAAAGSSLSIQYGPDSADIASAALNAAGVVTIDYPVTLGTPRNLAIHLLGNGQTVLRQEIPTGVQTVLDVEQVEAAITLLSTLAARIDDKEVRATLTARRRQGVELVELARREIQEAVGAKRTLPVVEWEEMTEGLAAFQRDTLQPILWTRNPLIETRPESLPDVLESTKTVEIVAAGSDRESGALLISNLFGKREFEFRIHLGDPERQGDGHAPEDPRRDLSLGDIELAEAVMIETAGRGVIAEPVAPLDAAGRIKVPPGETREVWVTVDTTGVRPGRYHIPLHVDTVDFTDGPEPMQVDVRVRILEIDLPTKLPIRVYNFDYGRGALDGSGHLQEMLRSRVNVFFVPEVPLPDDEGNVDFSRLDHAVKRLSPHGVLFVEVWFMRDTGWQEPRFARWVEHLVAYMKGQGLGYDDWLLQIFDESMSDRFLECARNVKRVDPQVRIFQDHMDEPERIREFAPYIDVWCPVQHQLGQEEGLQAMRDTGRPVWTYECGTTPGFTPAKHRFMAWRAWHFELDGVTFWTYSACSWNDPSRVPNYGLYYPSSSGGPIPSKRWVAWREGLADYLYLRAYTAELDLLDGIPDLDREILRDAHALGESGEVNDIDRYDQVRRRLAERILELRN